MSKSIFISRTLRDRQWLEATRAAGHTVVEQSLLRIVPEPFDLPETDWFFFYSAAGVRHFFEGSQAQLSAHRWACIGTGTASVLRRYVLDIDFIGDGDWRTTAPLFAERLRDTDRICFVQGATSRQSVQAALQGYDTATLTVYSNTKSTHVPSGDFDIVAFTSPLNAEAYYDQRPYQGEAVLAIGATTAQYLHELGLPAVQQAASASEKALLQAVGKWLCRG